MMTIRDKGLGLPSDTPGGDLTRPDIKTGSSAVLAPSVLCTYTLGFMCELIKCYTICTCDILSLSVVTQKIYFV